MLSLKNGKDTLKCLKKYLKELIFIKNFFDQKYFNLNIKRF